MASLQHVFIIDVAAQRGVLARCPHTVTAASGASSAALQADILPADIDVGVRQVSRILRNVPEA